MLKLELLNMAFGLVHSSVERSTSRHGHLQASARLLYQLALVLVLGLIVWKCIRITCPCDLYPLTPHFYIVKWGFTGVYIIFFFLL